GDGHEHDIHYADAAHHQSHRRDNHHRDRKTACDRAEVVENTFGSLHPEIVVRGKRHLAAHAQHVAHLVLTFIHHACTRDCQNVNVVGVGFEFLRHREWHVDHIVLIVAAAADEKLFSFFKNANDAKLLRSDLDRLAHR